MIMIEENEQIRHDLIEILKKMNIPFVTSLDCEECIRFIKNDKKAKGNEIDIVKVNELGKAFIEKVKIDDLRQYIRRSL